MPRRHGVPAISASSLQRYLRAAALVLILLPVFSACAKRHFYPGDRRPDSEVAHIEADLYLMANVVIEIDGKEAGSLAQYFIAPGVAGGWPPGRPTKSVSVLAGDHKLSIRVASYGWISAARTACAAMKFQVQAAQRYGLSIEKGALFMRNLRTGNITARTIFADCSQLLSRSEN
jgi:hypothetical protein